MAIITDIKRRILELAPAQFQEFCDVLLSKMGYGVVHGYHTGALGIKGTMLKWRQNGTTVSIEI